MFSYLLRRLILLFITLIILTLIAWGLEFKLMSPVTGFWSGYEAFMFKLVHGDLGVSLVNNQSISKMLLSYLPVTLQLSFTALVFALLVGIPLGTIAALNRGRFLDLFIGGSGLVLYSVPVFWLALLGSVFFSIRLGWLPISGQSDFLFETPVITGVVVVDTLLTPSSWQQAAFLDALRHMILPSLVLAIVPTTEVIRHVRHAMIEIMEQNYIKAAQSCGVSLPTIICRYGWRNALPSLLPLISLQFGSILTATMMVEIIYDWPGVGRWLVQSIAQQDYAVIQCVTLALSSVVISINVFADLLGALLMSHWHKELYVR